MHRLCFMLEEAVDAALSLLSRAVEGGHQCFCVVARQLLLLPGVSVRLARRLWQSRPGKVLVALGIVGLASWRLLGGGSGVDFSTNLSLFWGAIRCVCHLAA